MVGQQGVIMELFPFFGSDVPGWAIIGIIVAASLATLLFLGALVGYFLRHGPPTVPDEE